MGAKGNLVLDAYHAAMAIETGSEWITTDRDYSRFPGLRWRHPLVPPTWAVPRGAVFLTVWLHLASKLELSELNELFDVLGIAWPVVAHRRPHLVASRVVRRAKRS